MTLFEEFVSHLESLKRIVQSFYDQCPDTPKKGFDEDHHRELRSSLHQFDYIMRMIKSVPSEKHAALSEWFEHENRYLSSYLEDPIDNYIHAIMQTRVLFRSMSDLWNQVN